jgi:O-methyltransferase
MEQPLSMFLRRQMRLVGVHWKRLRQIKYPRDFDEQVIETIKAVAPYTMMNKARAYGLVDAVRFVAKTGIPGAFVECGVWKGGAMMAVAGTLLQLGQRDRDLYLYDTYEGMANPGPEDVNWRGESAVHIWKNLALRGSKGSNWNYVGLEDVKKVMSKTGYDPNRLHFVKGLVENTIPEHAPESIALLKLHTDFYASTRHILEHLFPRLAPGGLLIVDDYHWWGGTRKAVDDYIQENNLSLFLSRVCVGARIAQKHL